MSSDPQTKEAGKTVLIPVDGSKNSEHAFQWYCSNMYQAGNEVILMHANDLPQSNAPYSYGYPYPGGWEETAKKSSVQSKRILQSFYKKCTEKNMKCRMFMESDSPTEAIPRLAKEKGADHIVMGSRGRDPISRTLSGSVSYFCTHHSDVPVSVVPPVSPDMDNSGSPPKSFFNDARGLYENNLGYI